MAVFFGSTRKSCVCSIFFSDTPLFEMFLIYRLNWFVYFDSAEKTTQNNYFIVSYFWYRENSDLQTSGRQIKRCSDAAGPCEYRQRCSK